MTHTAFTKVVFLVIIALFSLNYSVFSQSATATYSAGNISTSHTSYSATCTGPLTTLTVVIPAGANVTGMDVSYDMVAFNGAWMSEQRSQIHCQETGMTEATASGTGGNSGGTESYNRTGVSIANGITATGVLTFEMRAWRTWGGSLCDAAYQYIDNNTWSITVYYNIPGPMLYTSSTVTQSNLSTIENCAGSAEISSVEVVTTGSSPTIDLTSLTIGTSGTTDLSEISAINVYYTGTSGSYATTTLFGTAAPAASVTVNGTQTLASGTNYFWVEYVLNPPLTITNTFDASCTGITISGLPYVPTVTSPAGNRVVAICNPSPGGVSSDLEAWFNANSGIVGSPVTTWNNLGQNTNITQLTSANGGTLDASDPKANFNNIVNCTGGYAGTFHAEVPTRTDLISGNEVTMYTAYQRQSAPDLMFEFHGSTQTNSASNGANQWLTWGFRHAGIGSLYSNGTFYGYDAGTMAQMSENSGFVGLHGTSTAAGGNSVNGTETAFGSIGTFHAGGNYMELSIGYWPGYGMSRGVMEAILWDSDLSALERAKVETYLAIKYGVTMGINGTSLDYTSPTSGAVIWDVATNAGFNYDIAGVMRSDISGLDQRKSHSTNGPTVGAYNDIVTIAYGTNFGTPTFIPNDGAALVWGHDNGPTINTGVLVNYPTDNSEVIEAIFTREWKSQETGTLGTVTLEFDLSNVVGTGGVLGANDLAYVRLLVDEDGDYSVGATSIAPSSYDNTTGIVYFEHDFVVGTGNAMDQYRGYYFTLGTTDFWNAQLPVTLGSFNVTNHDCDNVVSWTTISEQHCDYFELSRSYDLENWEVIAHLDGAENSTSLLEYGHVDRAFDQNGTVYYRLVQVDTDGAETLLGTKGVQSMCAENSAPVLYPNPSEGLVHVFTPDAGTYTLFDAQGRMILEGQLMAGETLLTMPSLASGTYMIALQLNNGKHFIEQLIIL